VTFKTWRASVAVVVSLLAAQTLSFAGSQAWIELHTPHFVVVSNASEHEARGIFESVWLGGQHVFRKPKPWSTHIHQSGSAIPGAGFHGCHLDRRPCKIWVSGRTIRRSTNLCQWSDPGVSGNSGNHSPQSQPGGDQQNATVNFQAADVSMQNNENH
jgi:hypothetical protein